MTDQEIKDAAAAHAEAMNAPDYEPADREDAHLHSLARQHVKHGHVEQALHHLRVHLTAVFSKEQLAAMTLDHPEVRAWFERWARDHPEQAVPPKKPSLREAGYDV